jgi:starch phosphorylase
MEIMRMQGEYCPRRYYEQEPELRQVLEQLSGGHFSSGDSGLFQPIVQNLLERDRFFVLADYASYVKCQESVGKTYSDQDRWTGMAIRNVAQCGKFSSDRAIREYAQDIWDILPVKP